MESCAHLSLAAAESIEALSLPSLKTHVNVMIEI